jgi:Mg-chelatase subunit ChlD
VRKAQAEGAIDAVVALDISGSMNDGGRIEVARRTGLALAAYLQRLNPENTLRYIVFGNSRVNEVDAVDYYEVCAKGDTPMAGAIALGRKMLQEGRSSSKLLYVISDGNPNVGDVLAEAAAFNNPNHYLRFILMGVDTQSVANCKAIADAAGRNSRILPVRADKIDIAVFEDFASAFLGLVTADKLEDYV